VLLAGTRLLVGSSGNQPSSGHEYGPC